MKHNLLIRQRRQLGLWSFAYATAHVLLYLVLDAGSWRELRADLEEKPFIAWGLPKQFAYRSVCCCPPVNT